jgi:acyl-CoA thioester hydrolase
MTEKNSSPNNFPSCTFTFRVRYSETDQMKTYYNSRALEWFETGRSELLREAGKPYREMESLGVMLPVREAHVEYLGRAQYDDLLKLTATMSKVSRTQIRVHVEIEQAESGDAVCRGWTTHVVTNSEGRPIRPPEWFTTLLDGAQ